MNVEITQRDQLMADRILKVMQKTAAGASQHNYGVGYDGYTFTNNRGFVRNSELTPEDEKYTDGSTQKPSLLGDAGVAGLGAAGAAGAGFGQSQLLDYLTARKNPEFSKMKDTHLDNFVGNVGKRISALAIPDSAEREARY